MDIYTPDNIINNTLLTSDYSDKIQLNKYTPYKTKLQ